MSRCLLHIKKIDAFKKFCADIGVEVRDGKGDYEVIQVKLKSGRWMPIFTKNDAKEHVTVPSALHGLVWNFIKHRDEAVNESI